MKINIITRCSRVGNISKVSESIFRNIPTDVSVDWHVVFDTNTLKDIDAIVLNHLYDSGAILHFKKGSNWGLSQLNDLICELFGWVYHCDDDNIIHENFYDTIYRNHKLDDSKLAFVFSQQVDGKDFTGLDIRKASPENMKVKHIDLAQFIIHSDLHKGFLYNSSYTADGEFIEDLYLNKPEFFGFIPDTLSYYNFLEIEPTPKIPKVLYIGNDEPSLKSHVVNEWESSDLDARYSKDDKEIVNSIVSFKPDIILTRSDDYSEFKNITKLPESIRNKWANITNEYAGDLGHIAYDLAMNNILNHSTLENGSMISFFTPIYNTGDSLKNTYQSLANQTYSNWEWVLVNDSTDGGKTLKVAEEIASKDPRVKVYDFREKSGGCIGEVKWRACSMARGYILAELDHDDWIVSTCAEDLHNAAQAHSDCGMFYGDAAELFENYESNRYPDGWGFGYGSYRVENYNGLDLHVANTPNINPLTIRHIVGVPNHIRAFRRSVYFEVGGHNRELTVADDYELIVRMFLKTKICKIPKLTYIQFLYSNERGRNTHDLSRADIQRRVRTIAEYYHKDIYDRFTEMGLEDYVYLNNKNTPSLVEPRFGKNENKINIIYKS